MAASTICPGHQGRGLEMILLNVTLLSNWKCQPKSDSSRAHRAHLCAASIHVSSPPAARHAHRPWQPPKLNLPTDLTAQAAHLQPVMLTAHGSHQN
eukprot:1149801-Pelagomonas_calceolata.AAC.15